MASLVPKQLKRNWSSLCREQALSLRNGRAGTQSPESLSPAMGQE